MTEEERQEIQRAVNVFETMRRYQRRYFSGDQSSLKNAKYWEKQADDEMKRLTVRFKLEITQPKGPAAQGTLM